MDAASWRKEPKPVKGYAVIADSIRNYTNKFTGMDGQFYRMIALTTTRRPERGKKLLPGAELPPPDETKTPRGKTDPMSGQNPPPARGRKKNESRRN